MITWLVFAFNFKGVSVLKSASYRILDLTGFLGERATSFVNAKLF
jgi:hypothetical protein